MEHLLNKGHLHQQGHIMTIKNRIDMVIKIGHTIKDRETDTLEMAIKIEILTEETANITGDQAVVDSLETEVMITGNAMITIETTDLTDTMINSCQDQGM